MDARRANISAAFISGAVTAGAMIPPSSHHSFAKPPPENGERHILNAETELRLEIPSNCSITLTLLAGSAEIFGAELALASDLSAVKNTDTTKGGVSSTGSATMMMSKQSYLVSGNTKLAVFTWHGCTIDVDVEYGKSLDISYTSSETSSNIAYVNTHAQLEIYRDEALRALLLQRQSLQHNKLPLLEIEDKSNVCFDGPRVLIVGPPDSGKTSLTRILTAYAVKLGRTPILVDLDPAQNILSVPGTIAASVMTQDSISVTSYAGTGNTLASGTHPLVLWYGSTEVSSQPDLYQAQLYKLGQIIDARVSSNSNSHPQGGDVDTRASGLIINTCGWIEDTGYKLLLHAVSAFRVNVILVMGHDRLYSMLQTHYQKIKTGDETSSTTTNPASPKVIKLPRSGGVVSRDGSFRRVSRSLCIKRYFNGDLVQSLATPSTSSTTPTLIHQYTPVLLELSMANLRLYKLSSVSLSASMLPIAAKQTTDPVQLNRISSISPSLTHALLAVCHPNAVDAFDKSGNASDLYLSGVAGFLTVEKVNMDKDILTVLSPCSGSLPSQVMILGDVSWME